MAQRLACWAHNPEVRGSKPCVAKLFCIPVYTPVTFFFFWILIFAINNALGGNLYSNPRPRAHKTRALTN